MAEFTPQERFNLITRNLQEVLNPEIIEEIVVKQDKPLIVYWGNQYLNFLPKQTEY